MGRFFHFIVAALDATAFMGFVGWCFSDQGKWIEAAPRHPVEPDTVLVFAGFILANLIVVVRSYIAGEPE